MTFEEYIVRVARYQAENPDLRAGQCYYHVLHNVNPQRAEAIIDTWLDPHHDDNNIPHFLADLGTTWQE